MSASELELTIEVICTKLPGLEYEGRSPLHLGIQREKEIIEAAPADRDRIVFHPVLRVRKHTDGSPNFLGAFAQGPREERFMYLNWVIVKNKRPTEQIGRIKLHLNHLSYKDVELAVARKQPMKVTLQLTSEKSKAVFASVRADQAQWDVQQ